MLSAVKRYRSLVAGVLKRCFPRTSAHLRDEDELLFRRWGHGPDKAQPQSTSKRSGKAPGKPRGAKGKAKPKSAAKADAKEGGPAKPRRAAAQGIYPAAALKVDEGQVRAMRERVEQAVAAGIVSAPSEEQWAMILGRSPLTRIFAGAGSGKSTTLLLRVVFMLCHLGIEPGRLTVISFTNASCG
ncbi:UvrD-helicase domain-containing protein, partial [Stutzerimonas stutzeri]